MTMKPPLLTLHVRRTAARLHRETVLPRVSHCCCMSIQSDDLYSDPGDRVDLARRQHTVLAQLQEVTRRWHEEKAQLMRSFEEEHAIWADEKSELQQQLWSMTAAFQKASMQVMETSNALKAAEEELAHARTAPLPWKRATANFLSPPRAASRCTHVLKLVVFFLVVVALVWGVARRDALPAHIRAVRDYAGL